MGDMVALQMLIMFPVRRKQWTNNTHSHTPTDTHPQADTHTHTQTLTHVLVVAGCDRRSIWGMVEMSEVVIWCCSGRVVDLSRLGMQLEGSTRKSYMD